MSLMEERALPQIVGIKLIKDINGGMKQILLSKIYGFLSVFICAICG